MTSHDYSNGKSWQEIVSQQRTKLMLDHPFFATIILQLEVMEATDEQTNTLATDGKFLYVHPDFPKAYPPDVVTACLAHEAMHIALGHLPRMKGRDLKVWGDATDHVINNELKTSGFKLPSNVLCDPKYKNLSADQVYDQLMKQKKDNQNGQQEGGGKGNTPFSMGDMQQPKGNAQEQEKVHAENRVATAQAAAIQKSRNAGKLPGSIDRLLAVDKPKLDWRALLRSVMDDACMQDFSWMKRSRASLNTDFYFPGNINSGMQNLVVAIDTSGSIDGDLLKQFASEVEVIAGENSVQKITVIYTDASVQKVEEYEIGDQINMQPRGGGGTRFSPTFNHVEKSNPDAKLILYFTDLMCHDFGQPPPGARVVWCVHGDYANNVPFGEIIRVS